MGLDMYLDEEIYVGSYYEHRDVKGDISITVGGNKLDLPFNKIDTITIRIAQWRKANHIHYFFTKSLDDDRNTFVQGGQLEELLFVCHQVKESLENQKLIEFIKDNKTYKEYRDKEVALLLLPPTQGFFFGSDLIDEYYLQDILYTIEMIESLPSNYKSRSYTYIASY